jgi:hypothetical protein
MKLYVKTHCKENKDAGFVTRCTIDREGEGSWFPVLDEEVAEWCNDLGILFSGRVVSYRLVELNFPDDNHAILFKMTWL